MLTNSIHYKYIESVNNLSIKNVGITGSNPSVACLIVDFRINRKGVVLSYGLTSQTGRPHAEINALDKISKSQIDALLDKLFHAIKNSIKQLEVEGLWKG